MFFHRFSSILNGFCFDFDRFWAFRRAVARLEHLLSLWRSHLSVICDRELRRRPEISEEDGLLEQALEELHGDLLQGFRAWRQQFQVHQEEPRRPKMGDLRVLEHMSHVFFWRLKAT